MYKTREALGNCYAYKNVDSPYESLVRLWDGRLAYVIAEAHDEDLIEIPVGNYFEAYFIRCRTGVTRFAYRRRIDSDVDGWSDDSEELRRRGHV